MNEMKHVARMRLLLFLTVWGLFLPLVAQHHMKEVYVMVGLNQDGSANVIERRTATMGEQGTEGFVTFNNMGDIQVTNLRVEDETGTEYEVEERWNVERSREEKAGKCGYHYTDQGVELCWGIGKAGERVYYIYYTLTNLVKSYDDYDGFCHSFYEAANTPADQATVTISVRGDSLTKEKARIWTFGYDGQKGHAGGFLFAEADTLLRNGDAIIALVELEKGILQPTVKKVGLFKELVKRPAFVQSEYDIGIAMGDSVEEGNVGRSSLVGGYGGTGHEQRKRRVIEDDGAPSWELAVGFLLIVGLILWAASGSIKVSLAHKRDMKKKAEKLMELMGGKKWNELPYWRELPMQGNLLGSSAVLAGVLYILKESGNPIRGVEFSVQHLYEAFILRMFYQGGITLDYDTDQHGKTRQLFRIKEPVKPEKALALDVTRNTTSDYYLSSARRHEVDMLYKGLMHDTGIQYMLQDLLYKAADSDHLLQPDELKAYVNKNMEQLRPMADTLYRIAGSRVEDRELLMDEVQQVMGFLHYLKDFSLVKERHIEEVSLWKEYLVFASFYGIAAQVRQDMKKVAPDTTQLDQLIPPTRVVEDFRPITTALASSLATVRLYETDYERRQRRSSYSSGSSSSARSYSSSSGSSGHSSRSGGGGHSGGGGSGFR